MATTSKNDTSSFLVKSKNAVDIANMTAVASVNTDVIVTTMDGLDNPLQAGDMVQLIAGFDAINAGVAVQNCVYKDNATVTLRTTNPSAGAIDPASIAAGNLVFIVFRR